MTTSPSTDAGSSERRRVKEGEGLTPCRVGYRDSGSNMSKSMYSPLMMRCFTLSGSGGCCTDGAACGAIGRTSSVAAVAVGCVGTPCVAPAGRWC